MQQMENETDVDALKFLAALELMRSDAYHDKYERGKFRAIKRIAKNPKAWPIFIHDASVSDNINARSIQEVRLSVEEAIPRLHLTFLKIKTFTK